MEGIVIIIIGFIFKTFFGDDKEKNREKFKDIVQNIKETKEKIKTISKSENGSKTKSKLYNVDKKLNKDELKEYSYVAEEAPREIKKHERINVEQLEEKENLNEEFNLFNDSNDLVKALIMSEILSKPKSIK